MPNRLIQEISPYLLLHAHNPVDWYPWGEEALARAHAEQKPIFLSIGYTACHWCHVMESESFQDPTTAHLLNSHFISIKVDREERPDLDEIYINAVVAMTGSGGWPMSVFLTPDLQPFYGGTYFPPIRRYNLPSFQELLSAIATAWQEDRAKILQSAQGLTAHLRQASAQFHPDPTQPSLDTVDAATNWLCENADFQRGGWGRAPRFPQPMAIEFLLQQASQGDGQALAAAEAALAGMQLGGIYDLVGGGFHRYSTTADWLIPHFEKMLYDNAQLARVYLHAYQLTRKPAYQYTCTRTLDFLLREMSQAQGGFFSSLDADSEGEEGRFYTWSMEEYQAALSPDQFKKLQALVSLPSGGNFEGRFILQCQAGWDVLAARQGLDEITALQVAHDIFDRLNTSRGGRVRPQADDKVITAWNGLALQACSEAARALNRPDYLAAAQQTAHFLLENCFVNGSLLRTWRKGQAGTTAVLEDYAAFILGLLALYQADFNPRWYQAALRFTGSMLELFEDPAGGFFDAPSGSTHLIFRPKSLQDNATPSGNALAALALLQLSELDARPAWRQKAFVLLASLQDSLAQYPLSFSQHLQALNFSLRPVKQAAVVWPQGQTCPPAMLEPFWQTYQPFTLVAGTPFPVPDGLPALLHNRPPVNHQATVYICQDFTCQMPYTL